MSFEYKEDFIVVINADLHDNAEIAIVFDPKTENTVTSLFSIFNGDLTV